MKKILICIVTISMSFWSCTKKEEVNPVGQSGVSAQGDATLQSKSFEDEIIGAASTFSPKVSNVTATSAVVTIGNESLFVEKDGEEVSITSLNCGNKRIEKGSLSGKIGDGRFVGILAYITRSNSKAFVSWISQEDPSPFEVLFGETLFSVFSGGPEKDTKPEIELNPKGLPKGAFLLKGKIEAESNGSGSCKGDDCGLVKNGKKVSIKANAGSFGFYIENQLYGHANGVNNIAFLVTNKLSKKDYVEVDGVRVYGTDGKGESNSFAWVLGLGKGTGSTPPLTGIVIAVAVNKSKTSAVFTIGAFQGLKIK